MALSSLLLLPTLASPQPPAIVRSFSSSRILHYLCFDPDFCSSENMTDVAYSKHYHLLKQTTVQLGKRVTIYRNCSACPTCIDEGADTTIVPFFNTTTCSILAAPQQRQPCAP